ncbi:J domain-containing protein [Solirubrobacter phytolaccae]|uniref:J domain-containing protein n=1 Tax=Solirubrobacter phytolaccae TaxID=1404360 RepID=A0A9X3NBL5_9ACTN|nr:J domain-containing protein [Solirubrobacter phytolaccae]MDA0182109.1 J domain-containing protein [Solirubrobacter phytolaccae]
MAKDPYRVLGLPYGAAPGVVLETYRRLVKTHHPDRNGNSPESTRRFQEIQLAFEDIRGRPVPDGSIEERLAKLQAELKEQGPHKRGEDPSLTRVNSLIDGLDDLASSLDKL